MPSEAGGLARVGRGLDALLTADYVSGAVKHRQFTDVARLVLGSAVPRPECERFWRSVAFGNPTGPSGGTRLHPIMTELDWETTRAAVASWIERLQPNALLLLGAELDRELRGGSLDQPRERLAPQTAVVPHPGAEGFDFRQHTETTRNLR